MLDIWRYYVYELYDDEGVTRYIGKGTGKRLSGQKSRYKLKGREIARFKDEQLAYWTEAELIFSMKPQLNKAIGGNGGWSSSHISKAEIKAFNKEMAEKGTRRMVAKLLWQFGPYWPKKFSASNIEQFRQVYLHG